MTPKEIDDLLLKVGTTGVQQSWFQRQEMINAVRAAFELGKAEGSK